MAIYDIDTCEELDMDKLVMDKVIDKLNHLLPERLPGSQRKLWHFIYDPSGGLMIQSRRTKCAEKVISAYCNSLDEVLFFARAIVREAEPKSFK